MTNEFAIDAINLNKEFDGKPAVIDVSLQVRRGEIFGFLGPNGSGKTTTIRMLCGLLKPDSGAGTCLGFDIIKDSLDIKLQVGYMTQRFSLYDDLSIKENLEFVARLYNIPDRNKAVKETIENLGLSQRRNELAGALSGGWKQRLALSAATIHQPQLLLLDEPTAGVDPEARREFWREIQNFAQQGITTLVSTHYMDEAERCNRLAYIAYGHMLAEGTQDDIVKFSKLISWQVRGPDVLALSEKLKHLPGLTQIAAFGNVLRISGTDAELMERSFAPYKTAEYQWQKIEPSLEDVFVALINDVDDQRAMHAK